MPTHAPCTAGSPLAPQAPAPGRGAGRLFGWFMFRSRSGGAFCFGVPPRGLDPLNLCFQDHPLKNAPCSRARVNLVERCTSGNVGKSTPTAASQADRRHPTNGWHAYGEVQVLVIANLKIDALSANYNKTSLRDGGENTSEGGWKPGQRRCSALEGEHGQ